MSHRYGVTKHSHDAKGKLIRQQLLLAYISTYNEKEFQYERQLILKVIYAR